MHFKIIRLLAYGTSIKNITAPHMVPFYIFAEIKNDCSSVIEQDKKPMDQV
jgi:hypothetical protein